MTLSRRSALLLLAPLLTLLSIFACAAVQAAPLSLTPAEAEWLRGHPVIRYGASPATPPASFVEQGRHWGYTADYMRLLGQQLGIEFRFESLPSLEAALKAARERRVDVLAPMGGLPVHDGALVFSAPVLPPEHDRGGSERALVIGVRGDWPLLVGIIDKAHLAIDPVEIEALRQRWRDIPDRGYSPQQVTLVLLTLMAGSLAITLLVVLWSARKRRSMARDIEHSEALFNAFFNASPAGMSILDRELHFVRINATQVRMYNQAESTRAGQSIEQMVPDLAAIVAPLMREVMLTGRSIHNVEVSGSNPADRSEQVHWLASFFPIYSRPSRVPLGVGQVIIDIGDRKRAELALRDSENRLRNVSNHLPVAVFQYRLAGNAPGFTYVSDGIVRLLQCTAEEVVANPARFLDAIHPDDREEIRRLMTEITQHRRPAGEIEWTGRRHPDHGPECWLQIRATVEEGHDGRFAISGLILDITQIKGVQQALERSRAELRRLSAHREGLVEREHQRLAREFHDELGQVLTTARMHLQMLERSLAAGTIEGARDAVKDIDGMIADAYRSVKTIASDLRPAALNLGLTAAVEWLAGRVLGAAKIRCTIAFDRRADSLDGDYSIALFRIVQESLTNIVRHAGADNVRIGLDYDDDCVQLDIVDNGKGFDATSVDRSARFGLLGISERVESLGGTLRIDSEPGKGTRLSVTLLNIPPVAEAIHRSASSS